MVYLIVNWVLSTVSLLLVASVLPGFRIMDVEAAILATGMVGLISALLGLVLKQVAGVATLAMSGAFLFLVDAFLFRLFALLVPGFTMRGLFPAFAGAAVLLGLNLALMRLMPQQEPFDADPLDNPPLIG